MIDPAPYDHTTELLLAQSGDSIDVWDEYVISLDMLSAGSAWTFAFWRSEAARTAWSTIKQKVRLGDDVGLLIDGAAQLTGRVESLRTEASRQQGATVILSGRDLAGPAMDFDCDPTLNLLNMQLGVALPQIFAELGLPVTVTDSVSNVLVTSGRARALPRVPTPPDPPPSPSNPPVFWPIDGSEPFWPSPPTTPGTPTRRATPPATRTVTRTVVIDRGHANPGEKVWQFVQSIVARLGYLCWVAPSVDRGISLVVDVPVTEGAAQYVFLRREISSQYAQYEGNVLSGGETITSRGVPTRVSVYTGSDRGAQISARSATTVQNTLLTKRGVSRGLIIDPFPAQPYHRKSVRARTPERAKQEASREVLESMRNFRTYEYTVRGHGQTIDGQRILYALNTIARVRDDVCVDAEGNPLDEDMLITGIEFRRSRQSGTLTKVRMVPLGSLVVIPTEGG